MSFSYVRMANGYVEGLGEIDGDPINYAGLMLASEAVEHFNDNENLLSF